MSGGPRAYTPLTYKRLFALSGNICAFPGCSKLLVNENHAKNSNICHIEAANEGGERYNIGMTDKQRADYPNLILLCVDHHEDTNDVNKYPREKLWEMKNNHESEYLRSRLAANPSMLVNTVSAIADLDLVESEKQSVVNPFNPEDKLRYNGVTRNYELIQEYKIYHSQIDSLYDELEVQGSIKKDILLRKVRHLYLTIKGRYVTAQSEVGISEFSDQIIEDVQEELCKELSSTGFWNEDVILSVGLIMVDAFIRCKILEEPK